MRAGERIREWRMLFALCSGCAAYAVSQTLLIPSLPEIQRELHTSAVGVTSLLSVFLAAGAVTCGVFGRLGDMYGKKQMIMAQLALFAVGAVICALAPSLPVLLVGRAVMGCAVGIFALSYAVVGEQLPPRRIVGAVALIGAVLGSGAVVGQGLGGLVTDTLGYRWIFWIAFASAVPGLVFVALFVPESPLRTRGRIDYGGAAIFALALGVPLIAISEAPVWGWGSLRTAGLIATAVPLLALLVAFERRREEPLIHFPTLWLPRVRVTNFATFFVGFGMFGVGLILSQLVQIPKSSGYGLGVNATQAGFFLIPGLLASLLVAPFAARLSNGFGPKRTLIVGTSLGTVAIASLALAHDAPWEIYLWTTLLFAGLGTAFAAMPALILQSAPREHSGQSTSINLILRNTGSSIGIQTAATFIASSAHGRRFPTDAGFTHAFVLLACGAGIATVVAATIPAHGGSRRRTTPAEEAPVVSEAFSP